MFLEEREEMACTVGFQTKGVNQVEKRFAAKKGYTF